MKTIVLTILTSTLMGLNTANASACVDQFPSFKVTASALNIGSTYVATGDVLHDPCRIDRSYGGIVRFPGAMPVEFRIVMPMPIGLAAFPVTFTANSLGLNQELSVASIGNIHFLFDSENNESVSFDVKIESESLPKALEGFYIQFKFQAEGYDIYFGSIHISQQN